MKMSILLADLLVSSLTAVTKPNVLIIITDDQGWGDIGYNSSGKVYTPNMDKLAATGIQLTQHYTMSQCTPHESHSPILKF